MTNEGPRVEFDRQVPRPLFEGGEPTIDVAPAVRLWRSVRFVRWGAMFGGAALIAFLTHRSGLSLDGALCVFIGLLPVLWIVSWLVGLTFGARRAATLARSAVEQAGAQGPIVRIEKLAQHVALNVAADALEVTLKDAEQSHSHRWPWGEVQLIRQDGAAFWLHREREAIEVPRTAFADAQAFEAFALAAQARIWAAMQS
jgi:hypothetical protein